jgi:hypothetical protein
MQKISPPGSTRDGEHFTLIEGMLLEFTCSMTFAIA